MNIGMKDIKIDRYRCGIAKFKSRLWFIDRKIYINKLEIREIYR